MITEQGVTCRVHGDARTLVGPQVSLDTRQLSPGALFVGLPGARHDGAELADQAAAAGAAAALVGHQVATDLPCLVVDDAVEGLSALAAGLVALERQRGLTTFAITGSNGKTTTKDLLAQILESQASTVSPVGNHNNEIGVPLAACAVDDTTRYLVSEMGARAIGDVARLCRIVPPTIATVLNVGTAHLGEFGSRDAIARAKGEIIEALPPDGWAVLNDDDPRVAAMAPRTQAHVARWTAQSQTAQAQAGTARPGQASDAELFVAATRITTDALQRASFDLVVSHGDVQSTEPVNLRIMGAHQVLNATAAATMAIAAGLAPAEVARALNAATTRSALRMELHDTAVGAAVIDDSYNANPDSMAAALRSLAAMGKARRTENPHARTIAVIGDMGELGDTATHLHEQLGELAGKLGIDQVIAVGEHAGAVCRGAQQAGADARQLAKADVASSIDLRQGDIVLVKASRSMAMEHITAQLLALDSASTEAADKEELPR